MPQNLLGHRQFRAGNRAPFRPNCLPRRWSSTHPSAKCRSQLHRDAGWYGTTSAAYRFGPRWRDCGRFPPKIVAEIDSAAISKGWNQVAGGGIQGVDEIHHSDQDALVFAISPVSEPAIRLRSTNSRVELPQELACRGIQRENFLR